MLKRSFCYINVKKEGSQGFALATLFLGAVNKYKSEPPSCDKVRIFAAATVGWCG